MNQDLRLPNLPADLTIHMAQQASWPKACHIFEPEHWWAIQTAYGACRPLLVTGDPGLGKSQLARAVAQHLGRAFLPFVVQARSEASDLLYYFDAVARLAKAQVIRLHKQVDFEMALAEKHFTTPGPLWWALNWQDAVETFAQHKHPGVWLAPQLGPDKTFDSRQGCVVLIDEIDKADSDLPNGLLEVLGNGGFAVPLLHKQVYHTDAQKPPLIIITTNQERELPAAFMRRCVVLPLTLPEKKDDLMAELMAKGRAHFPDMTTPEALQMAAEQLYQDRQQAIAHTWVKPGLAEYLDLLRALIAMEKDKNKHVALIQKTASFVFKKQRRYD